MSKAEYNAILTWFGAAHGAAKNALVLLESDRGPGHSQVQRLAVALSQLGKLREEIEAEALA